MREHLQLYSWLRSGASIYLGRISAVQKQPADPGMETVTVQVSVEEALRGEKTERLGPYKFVRPVGLIGQFWEPDPVWGATRLEEGVPILIVISRSARGSHNPLSVEQTEGPGDTVVHSIRDVLNGERAGGDDRIRFERYLGWLRTGTTEARLFAGEALAKDDLHDVDQKGEVAAAFARVFANEKDPYLRISLATWMWQKIYPRSNQQGQSAIIDATIQGAEGADEDVQRFCLDRLEEADPVAVRGAVNHPRSRAMQLLQQRMDRESDPQVRDRMRKIIEALRG